MALLTACVTGGSVGLAGLCAWSLSKSTRPIDHISTGEQRRKLHPLTAPTGPGAASQLTAADICVNRELITLADGTKIFRQIVKPVGCVPSKVFVFLHGYTNHSDMDLEFVCSFARRGAVAVLIDLPNHGRSDGLFTYIPDWWSWVTVIWEALDAVVPPLRMQANKSLPVFAAGISLGGGLLACLAIQRPTFFDGIMLLAPMLSVSDEIKPPMIVQKIFKHVLKPCMPTLPITPGKSLAQFYFRVPEQGEAYAKANPMSMQGLQARLASAYEFVFTYPDWLKEQRSNLRTPFLVLHGTADKITDPNFSQHLYDDACATDKTIKLYDGAFHCELLCCVPGVGKLIGMDWLPEQVDVTSRCIKDMADWMEARV